VVPEASFQDDPLTVGADPTVTVAIWLKTVPTLLVVAELRYLAPLSPVETATVSDVEFAPEIAAQVEPPAAIFCQA
jgi:hypothetical protein